MSDPPFFLDPVFLDLPTPPEQKIAELWCWIAVQPDGGEGIISGPVPHLGNSALLGSTKERAERLLPLVMQALAMSPNKGVKVELRRFAVVKH